MTLSRGKLRSERLRQVVERLCLSRQPTGAGRGRWSYGAGREYYRHQGLRDINATGLHRSRFAPRDANQRMPLRTPEFQ
jgi:hypothetical protein